MTQQEAIAKVITLAQSEIGYREGDNNYNKFAEDERFYRWYGWKPQYQPYCDVFVDWLFMNSFGLDAAMQMTYQPMGRGSALCRTSAQYYKKNNAWYGTPQVGDQVFFYADGEINHTGIVESVGGGLVCTIEGNTSDMVARRRYALNASSIAGYGRPKWSAVSDAPAQTSTSTVVTYVIELPELKQGNTGDAVKSAQLLLTGRGCDVGWYGADGDFGPATYNAVCRFQRRNNLDEDGIIGGRTWQALLGVQR